MLVDVPEHPPELADDPFAGRHHTSPHCSHLLRMNIQCPAQVGMMAGVRPWEPVTPEEFRGYLNRGIAELNPDDLRLYEQYKVTPFLIFINRPRTSDDEKVYVAARRDDRVIVFEDVEDMFAVGRLVAPDRVEIMGWWDDLGWAIRALAR